jgi:hypothetical protein
VRGAFRRFVAQGTSGKEGKEIEEQGESGLLGDRAFRQRIQELLEGKELPDEIPLRLRRPLEIPVGQIRREVAGEWRMPEEALARRRGARRKEPRSISPRS